MTELRNWAGNVIFGARGLHRPTSIEAARRLVAESPRIRAIGTRHSFNALADTTGDLIDLGGIPPDFAIDAEGETVTVGAATDYGTLAVHLHEQGWALHNMGSLPHISVAGATATGTHGSGDRNGNLSTAVAALQLITADGGLIEVRREDAGFDGMVVGLGAFGVVTRVSLDIQPTFDMRQDGYLDLPWDALLADFDAVMSATYSVSLMTMWSTPHVARLWLKTRLEPGYAPASVPVPPVVARHLASIGANHVAEAINPFGSPGPWSDRLTHFRRGHQPGPGEQIQSEYMLPRPHAVEAIARLRGMGERIDPVLLISEIRTMAADNLWLSPSFGGDSVAIHFTWKLEPAAVDAITREIEELLVPLGARPHWGKVMHAPAARLAAVYPRLDDFGRLAREYDPGQKFANAFLARHVFGQAQGGS